MKYTTKIVLRQFQMRLYWAYSNQPRIDNKTSVGNQDMCLELRETIMHYCYMMCQTYIPVLIINRDFY